MAYDHEKVEYELLGTGAVGPTLYNFSGATGAALKSVWNPGFQPHIVRAAAIIGLTTAAPVTKPVFKFFLATAGTTTTVGTVFSTITLTSTSLKGKTFYDDKLNQRVNPGQQVGLAKSATATAGTHKFRAVLYVEPSWERGVNITGARDSGT